jgi:cardiolipin synthase
MSPNKLKDDLAYMTFSNASDLLSSGVKIYTYENGFIHSKMCLIDDEIVSVGTANMDFRSFELNFEVNAFVYDENALKSLARFSSYTKAFTSKFNSKLLKSIFAVPTDAKDLRAAYEHDITKSKQLTEESYANRPLSVKFKESFYIILL